MQPRHGTPTRIASLAIVAIGTLLAACTQQRPVALEQARDFVQATQADPTVARYAAGEADAAQARLASADQAWQQGLGPEETVHRSMLATEQAKIARAVATERESKERIKELGLGRDQLLRQRAEQETVQARLEAAALRQQLAELQAKPTERGLVLTLGDVLFDVDKASLKPGAMTQINRLATFLQENAERTVRIEGHTDNTGNDTYNQQLSQARAVSVQNALIAAGVEPGRIVAVGLGEDFPVASNDTPAGRQQNRRVEVVIQSPRQG